MNPTIEKLKVAALAVLDDAAPEGCEGCKVVSNQQLDELKTACDEFVKLHTPTDRTQKIVQMAIDEHTDEGTLEVDKDALLSEGSDNGTYVQAWVWVDFTGTEFDKEKVPA